MGYALVTIHTQVPCRRGRRHYLATIENWNIAERAEGKVNMRWLHTADSNSPISCPITEIINSSLEGSSGVRIQTCSEKKGWLVAVSRWYITCTGEGPAHCPAEPRQQSNGAVKKLHHTPQKTADCADNWLSSRNYLLEGDNVVRKILEKKFGGKSQRNNLYVSTLFRLKCKTFTKLYFLYKNSVNK